MSSTPQAERIRQAVLRSLRSRDKYTEQQVKKMLSALKDAETEVKAELMRIKEKSIISKGLEIRQSQLKGIQKEIDATVRELKKQMSLSSKRSLNGAYRQSLEDVVSGRIWVCPSIPTFRTQKG